MGTGGSFHRGQSGWGMGLTTHLHLVPRSRMCVAIPSTPPTCLHGMMLS